MKKLLLGLILISNIAFSQGTQISGSQIKDGAITNAKISNTAGISYTKINFAGATPTIVGAEVPLSFVSPLVRTTNSISLNTVPVSLGGTGLTSADLGLIPFGTGTEAFATNLLFNWNDAETKLSVPYLKVTGNSPQVGYVLTASDTDGNLTFTDPAAVIPSIAIISNNQLVVGTGTGIQGIPDVTYNVDGVFNITKNWTAEAEDAGGITKDNITTSATYDAGVYDLPALNTYGITLNSTILGSSAVLSQSFNNFSSNLFVNKPVSTARNIDVGTFITKEVTVSYPLFGRTYVSAGANVTRAFGVYARVQGDGGTVANAYSGFVAQPVLDTAGTITSAAVFAIGPPFSLPGSPVYATNQTWLLIGTNVIPAGNWAINSTSTDPSVFAGKVDAPNITGIRTEVADYTATPLDHTILVDASSGNKVITLPAASDNLGATFIIKKIDATANTVTVDGNALELIDGSTTVVIGAQWISITVQSNGTDWFIL